MRMHSVGRMGDAPVVPVGGAVVCVMWPRAAPQVCAACECVLTHELWCAMHMCVSAAHHCHCGLRSPRPCDDSAVRAARCFFAAHRHELA